MFGRGRKFLSVFFMLGAAMLLASCAEEQPPEDSGEGSTPSPTEETMMEVTGMEGAMAPDAEGVISVESDYDVDETISRLEQNAEDGGNMVVATVDHAQSAEDAGLDLAPTTLLIFGNPEAGTGLMQASRSMGIDLPQKFLAWEDEGGQTWLAYNDIEYLAERHGITGMDEQIQMISANLRDLAEATTGGTVTEPAEETAMEETAVMEETSMMDSMAAPEGLVTVESAASFEETAANVEGAIEEGGLNLVASVDHSENAASVGEELPPTTLFVFGNPEAGTPLMQSSRTVGIDLPQKMLVWEDEAGQVNVSYNDPEYLAGRHGLEGVDEQIETVSAALEMLAANATGAMEATAEETAEETTS